MARKRLSLADFFTRYATPPAERRLARIARRAHRRHRLMAIGCLHELERPAVTKRWAVRQLEVCRLFDRGPPRELVALFAGLLEVDRPGRDGRRKNWDKFLAAAEHVARRPDATSGQIRRAIKYDQRRVIAEWLEDSEFQVIVELKRQTLRARDES